MTSRRATPTVDELIAKAVADERERIAVAIEALEPPPRFTERAIWPWQWGRDDAARIARGAAS